VFLLKKSSVLLAFILLLLTLSGCRANPEISAKTTEISFTALTSYNETDYEIDVSTTKNFDTEFTIKSPEELRNLKLTFSGDSVLYNYMELEYSANLSQLSEDSPFVVIYKGLCDSSEGIVVENNRFYNEFTIGDKKYIIYFGQTGLPIDIETADGKKFAIFKSVSILG